MPFDDMQQPNRSEAGGWKPGTLLVSPSFERFPVNKRHFFRNTLAVAAVATLSLVAQAQDKVIKVGVTAGPHAQLMD